MDTQVEDVSEKRAEDEKLDKTESGEEFVSDEDNDDDDEDGEEEDDDNSDEDDDEDDDEDVDDDENEDDEEAVLESSDSDITDDNDRCPICLNRFKDQDVGTPESCDHMFCLECIQEWSKNVNTCPSDRQVFKLILCRHGVDDVIYKKISVEDRNVIAEEEEEEEPTYCEVCHECNREDRLLLCDGCDLGYHLECLTPPLSTVPVEEWFCPACARREDIASEATEDYVPGSRHRWRRQIPRTLVMERVRSAIEEIRVRRTRNLARIISSDEDEPVEVEETAAAATASASSPVKRSPRKRKTPAKRKTRRKYRKRKTKRKSTSTKKTPNKTTRKTSKRKTKSRKRKGKKVKRLARTAKPSPVSSVKTRIAGALGISNPPPGRTIPVQKTKQDKFLDNRSDIGGTSLSIFGDREELNFFEDEHSEPSTSAEPTGGIRKYSRLAMSSYMPIGRVPTVPAVKQKKKIVINTATPSGATQSSGGGVLDLLGSIMQDQTKLAMGSKDVTIQRDGSLTAKPVSPEKTKKIEKSSESSSTPSLFKSSFQAVDKNLEKSSSVLSSLATEKEKSISLDEGLEEEYDPAHPTDDPDDDVNKSNVDLTEDEYDPAHPTDDVSSDEESINKNTANDSFEVDKLAERCDGNSSALIETNEGNISNSENDRVVIEQSKQFGTSISCEDSESKTLAESAIFTDNEKGTSVSQSTNINQSADSPVKKAAKLKTPEKLSPSSTREVPTKISPSVKITESKKSPSGVKPFEISRKTLFDKRRLYGGEIDFSEDVDFSEGAFPETFELSVKKIEEVFKDTKSANESKEGEKNKNVSSAGVDDSDVKLANVEVTSLSKSDGVNEKDKLTGTMKSSKEEKQKEKHGKDSSDKPKMSTKLKPIDDDVEYSGTTKLSVSDRFKMIDKTSKTPESTNFDEEDPIHEMRKLDKELDLEFGNAEFSKKRDKGKEIKKSKRKVSLDDNEGDGLRYRRESKENRDKKKSDGDYKYVYEEKEEGEVDEEYKLKDKKKKDKKKKKIDKHFDNEEKEDSEIDRRIVIQVSQNTEDRTVWEEAERQRRKRDREEKRKDKSRDLDGKKDRKSKRMRSRSRSHERRRSRSKDRKRSRSRDRDRSRDKGRKKRRERSKSRSRSREWSYERSRKKKKRDRKHSRDRERDVSREWSRERSHEREWSWEKDWSSERGRERNRSRDKSRDRLRDRKRARDQSDDKVDMFGRSRSPFTRKEFMKDKPVLSQRPKVKPFRSDEVIEILDSSPPKKQKYDEVSSSESEKMSPEHTNEVEVQKISTIEVKNSGPRESNVENEEKDDEFDDEPEETEQFQYTDREEFTGQNKSKQMRQNLITLGVGNSDYDPANPTDTASPAAPPLPDPLQAPTPPLPPSGDFAQFPPPPPGPPPQGPPPVIIQDHSTLHVPPGGSAPGQGILGEAPLLIQGPPPIETGPPGIIQQRPAMSLPVNINVLPPGFHRGLPPTITPQRQLIVSPLRAAAPPRVQRLPGGNVRFGWQVTTSSEVVPSQFGTILPSPARLPGHPIVNGPFEGLPSHSEASHNLPPGHQQFPPHSLAPADPQPLISIKNDAPPRGMVQIVDKGPRTHLRPSGPGDPQLIHIGPDPRAPPPQLPIPLLPPSSDPLPISAMVSIPPPNSSLLSMPPPDISNCASQPFNRPGTPPDSVSTILGLARMGAGAVSGAPMIPGLQAASAVNLVNGNRNKNSVNGNGEIGKVSGTLNQLEKIGELLNTQAQLMVKQNSDKTNSGGVFGDSKDIFKIPVVPAGKSGGKADIETTEVVDMDMGSPIIEEGNIELPVSPQFDNLIDNPEDLLEEDFNKKMQKLVEKEMKKEGGASKEKAKDKPTTPVKNKDIKDIKETDSKNDSPRKSKEEKQKRSKENKPEKSGHRSRRHHHHHKKHADAEKDLKQKALKDAHIDLDSQELPSSAVEMTNKEKYLQKLHLQERVVEEVKMAIKPFYSSKKINKDQYKEILRKAVPKICHSKSGNINPMKIKSLVEAYVEKFSKRSKLSPHMEEHSPSVKANGERGKAKTVR